MTCSIWHILKSQSPSIGLWNLFCTLKTKMTISMRCAGDCRRSTASHDNRFRIFFKISSVPKNKYGVRPVLCQTLKINLIISHYPMQIQLKIRIYDVWLVIYQLIFLSAFLSGISVANQFLHISQINHDMNAVRWLVYGSHKIHNLTYSKHCLPLKLKK